MTRRARPVLLVCLGALLALGGCGGGGDDGAPESQGGKEPRRPADAIGTATSTLDVSAGDLFFKPKAFEAPSGTIGVNLLNTGSLLHTLKVEGEKDFKLSVARKGDTDAGEIRLSPGEYVLYCDVPGHRVANMEATLVVK